IKGIENVRTREKDGYLYLTKAWKEDFLQIEFPMAVQVIGADPSVREDIGKAAVMRGPVVYCLEEADNGQDLHLLKMDEDASFETEWKEISTESVIAVRAQGWRQKKAQNTALYAPYESAEYERTTLTWIPYYTWANRGEGEMQVWTRI
ncbi:MAG: glycoside hydrolase family 127 protein, partial [Lachnospiraceae bacterium]|nr:glycoside hydrolase family 127 protein [Lachnospiraceae bacterium]